MSIQPIEIYGTSTEPLKIRIETGDTRGTLKPEPLDTATIHANIDNCGTFVTSFDIAIGDQTNPHLTGWINLTLSPTKIAALQNTEATTFEYDVKITLSDGTVRYPIQRSPLTLVESVTQ